MTDYPRPALTADVAAFSIDGDAKLRLLFIRRAKDPFAGSWALPGGFVEQGESAEQGAARELEEETGLTVASLEQIGAFTEPGRDPRGWVVTVAFLATLPWDAAQRAKGGDDAAEAKWLEVQLPGFGEVRVLDGGEKAVLAFDHDDIVAGAVARLHQSLGSRGPR